MSNIDPTHNFTLVNERLILSHDDIRDYKLVQGYKILKNVVWKDWYAIQDEERNKYHIIRYAVDAKNLDEDLEKYVKYYKELSKDILDDMFNND